MPPPATLAHPKGLAGLALDLRAGEADIGELAVVQGRQCPAFGVPLQRVRAGPPDVPMPRQSRGPVVNADMR